MQFIYFQEHCHGFFDPIADAAYVMDDFGNAVQVPYCMYQSYWQEH